MKVQCAWCKTWLPDKAPLNDKAVSHTICKECSTVALKEMKKL